MADKGNSYIFFEDIPLERFENFVLPPMPAKDVVVLLAQEGENALSPDTAFEVRKLLIDNLMPENPAANREQVEAFVDNAVAEVRSILRS